MKLTRHTTKDRTCKYALVRLDKITKSKNFQLRKDAGEALRKLKILGILEYGEPGTEEECFVMKLKDAFTVTGLWGYRAAICEAIGQAKTSKERNDLIEYAEEIENLIDRSKKLHRHIPT